jgi:hypothetical protein
MTRNSNGVNVASSGSVIFASLIICFMLFLLLVVIDPQLDGLFTLQPARVFGPSPAMNDSEDCVLTAALSVPDGRQCSGAHP